MNQHVKLLIIQKIIVMVRLLLQKKERKLDYLLKQEQDLDLMMQLQVILL